jgi:dienelactone hydrolase
MLEWVILFGALPGWAQTNRARVEHILEARIQPPDVTVSDLRRFIIPRITPLRLPETAEQWTWEARQLRARILSEIVFHGWPREWVESAPKFEEVGAPIAGSGYRMRKLRYEIVPGFQSTAVLYEPETIHGRIPAILNVNGHVGPEGKAVEYKQKRSIQQARMGMLALNLEWLGYGELSNPENEHWFAAHLDLAGANGVGLFYLAMRRGLDYLWEHPSVDRARIGVTGLSGGGWQTIVLSALDERVQAAVPVAGYASYLSRLERFGDVGDIEQNATDMFSFADYTHLTALRAPRPTLLIYNAEDNCCFRATMVKDLAFDAILPFFRLYGSQDRLAWHENLDPADHNYQIDNRMHAYGFFARQFGLPAVEAEGAVGAEIRSPEELAAGLPGANLTILKLARRIAARATRADSVAAALPRLIRYRPVKVAHAWIATNTKQKELETLSYRFEFTDGLSATGVWLKAIAAPVNGPATIMLNDGGRKSAADPVSDRVNRSEVVLALDLLFTGDMAAPAKPGNTAFTQVLAALGERPLGIEAAQLVAVTEWLQTRAQLGAIRLEAAGMRSEVVGLLARALEPKLFREVTISGGISSLRYLLDAPVRYQQAPDLFCLDLLPRFDIPVLEKMPALSRIVWKQTQPER